VLDDDSIANAEDEDVATIRLELRWIRFCRAIGTTRTDDDSDDDDNGTRESDCSDCEDDRGTETSGNLFVKPRRRANDTAVQAIVHEKAKKGTHGVSAMLYDPDHLEDINFPEHAANAPVLKHISPTPSTGASDGSSDTDSSSLDSLDGSLHPSEALAVHGRGAVGNFHDTSCNYRIFEFKYAPQGKNLDVAGIRLSCSQCDTGWVTLENAILSSPKPSSFSPSVKARTDSPVDHDVCYISSSEEDLKPPPPL
jgi:hypothetical protein